MHTDTISVSTKGPCPWVSVHSRGEDKVGWMNPSVLVQGDVCSTRSTRYSESEGPISKEKKKKDL